MKLKKVQQQLMSSIQEHRTSDELLTNLVATELSQAQQLQIYQSSVKENLINVLKAAFPVCLELVGEQFFYFACCQYISKQKNFAPDVSLYGDNFADFIDDFAPANDLVYLGDVARLEWACHRALDSLEFSPCLAESLASLDLDAQMNLRLQLCPGATLIDSKYPISKIWHSNQPDAEEQVIDLDKEEAKELLLVYRNNWDLAIIPLSHHEYFMLNLFSGKDIFAEVCQKCLARFSDIDISAVFSKIICLQCLVHFTVK